MQDLTNSTAASMSMAFSSPNRVNAATAQKENRVSTSPHLSPESIGHTHILFLRSLKYLLEKILFSFVQNRGIRFTMLIQFL